MKISSPPSSVVECVYDSPMWENIALEPLAERAARATLAHLNLPTQGFCLCLLACDDARISHLNAAFRDKPTPTNVLSWPAQERGAPIPGQPPAPVIPGPPEAPTELGDIALAYETCLREAQETEKSIEDHTSHLIVHAILHLLGYDHIHDDDATLMEGLEVAILAHMGLENPY